jgi:hypothetical protein
MLVSDQSIPTCVCIKAHILSKSGIVDAVKHTESIDDRKLLVSDV